MKNSISIVFLIFSSSALISADPRSIIGEYRNPSLGYAITVPKGLQGTTGDQAGPERGLSIALASGGAIAVYGEPNSQEWKNPAEGIEWSLALTKCESNRRQDLTTAIVGKISGAKGTLICGNRFEETMLVFRPGGGPIYWLTLRTTIEHQKEEQAIFDRVVGSFRLIRWQ